MSRHDDIISGGESGFFGEGDGFILGVSERTLCGALMYHLRRHTESNYSGYYADVEYNRIVYKVKCNRNGEKINCDLILHGRGRHPEQDNLIILEMKKVRRPAAEKQKDRERLMEMTDRNGEHGYLLGVYYEIEGGERKGIIEYYIDGALHEAEHISIG